ncbi:MAG: 4-alpha-glucanotransferase [Ruminococcaceae bacterium]|nr:4-alpha-glucanotransferase [Oscillospiraceae bacterium]
MRKAGVLLPVSSLPSPYGIGTLGRQAYDFVDFLVRAGQNLWQVLPVGPTGFGDSPYQSFSAMAGNPYFIDLELLAANGLLERREISRHWGEDPGRVDYNLLFRQRPKVLAKAVARQNKAAPDYRAFCEEQAFWLDDYALYMAIKEAHGHRGFMAWPEELRLRHPEALKAARAQYAPQMEYRRCTQFFFYQQWMALKQYANAAGVDIVGDIPIYVSDDSSDLWANPELFLLDDGGHMRAVAGVPPDAFSADGQLWGNPLYNWPQHNRTHYAWWIARLRHSAQLYDITRIDHFRGFAGFYAVPPGDDNARRGRWVKGPGMDFMRAINSALPDIQIIAEDLGYLTREVHELLALSGFPGMKVLQFAFDSREESDYLPHNYQRHTVVYTGTHDNNTTRAWAHEARREDITFARRYLGIGPRQNLTDAMIRSALSSVAETAVVPLQDWLGLGAEARINTPSTLGGNNWCWRLQPGQLTDALAAHMRLYTRTWGRLSAVEKAKEQLAAELAEKADTFGTVMPVASERSAEKLISMVEDETEPLGDSELVLAPPDDGPDENAAPGPGHKKAAPEDEKK